jgi:hypothetical protein
MRREIGNADDSSQKKGSADYLHACVYVTGQPFSGQSLPTKLGYAPPRPQPFIIVFFRVHHSIDITSIQSYSWINSAIAEKTTIEKFC